MGCPLITDDGGLTSNLFGGEQFAVTVKKTRDFKRLLATGEWRNLALSIDRHKLMQTARAIAPVGFWKSFENAESLVNFKGQVGGN